jgi:hypothetical protein
VLKNEGRIELLDDLKQARPCSRFLGTTAAGGLVRSPARQARPRIARRPARLGGRFVLGGSKRNCDVARSAVPRHLEFGAMVGRGGIHRSS